MKKTDYILHLASWYPSRVDEFNGDFVQRNYLTVKERWKGVLLYLVEDPSIKSKWKKEYVPSEQDERIYYLPLKKGPIRYLVQVFYYSIAIRKLFREKGRPLIIHSHVSIYSGLVARFLHFLFGIPYVITEHSSIYNDAHPIKDRRWYFFWTKVAAHRASSIFPVSKNLRDSMIRNGIKGNYRVIPNLVEDYFFDQKLLTSEPSTIRFLHVSSLDDPVKNVSGILSACKALLDASIDYSLTIVGNTNHQWVIEAVANMGLNERVQVIGPLAHREVGRQMAQHDCFVLFSNYENLPCVLLEAQAVGLPCVGPDVGGVPEIIMDKRFGQLVQPGNVDELVAILKKIANREFQFDSHLIRNYAKNHYQRSAIAKRTAEIYQSILNRQPNPLPNKV